MSGALSAPLGWLVAAVAIVIVGWIAWRKHRDSRTLALALQGLTHENAVLQRRVEEREQSLADARVHANQAHERIETVLQDTSHRIGNSLATVSSLLGLQMIRSNSEEVKQALEAARARVHAIASAHRRMRLGDDFETANTDDFLDAVLQDMARTLPSGRTVALVSEVDAIPINARDATTLGILIGELVSNALKHGYPAGREGRILVRLRRDDAGIPVLWVIDDGVGLDDPTAVEAGGLGSVIIKQLAQQFGGVPDYERRSEGGLAVSVPLPGIVQVGS